MSAGDYTITVVIDAWSATIDKGDPTDPAADAITVDPLNAAWSLRGGYPSQPNPTTCSFGLFVPDIITGPRPVQGSLVEITITTPDHDPAAVDIAPVFEFVGRITDVDARPRKLLRADGEVSGLTFSIVATDHRSSLGEERIGDEPWPEEARADRLDRIIAASGLNIVVPAVEAQEIFMVGLGPAAAARDVDSQPTGDVLDALLSVAPTWLGFAPAYWTTGYLGTTFKAPSLATWVRPIVSQSVDAGGVVSFPITFIPGGLPDVDAALPYTVALASGQLGLVRKAITPDTSLVCWIPSSAIEAESVRWFQSKATNTNRARAVVQGTASKSAEFSDLIAANGPNEVTVTLDTDLALVIEGGYAATNLIHAILGTHYDASPRWALDEITIRAEEIADGDQWPRLFDPREHAHIFDRAAGRFVLITDPLEGWNLHDRADYFGRLAAASLQLSGGRIQWTASLAHRLPIGAGVESDFDTPVFATDPPDYTGPPTHHPITCAELAAGANPLVNQCGDLTPADLQLVEG